MWASHIYCINPSNTMILMPGDNSLPLNVWSFDYVKAPKQIPPHQRKLDVKFKDVWALKHNTIAYQVLHYPRNWMATDVA